MSAEQDARAKAVLDGALDLRGTARSAFIEQKCAGDGALRSRVEALLEGAERDDDFLAGVTEYAVPEPPVEEAGARIGAYKLLQAIGEGGFGRVYRAWDPTVGRMVAIKTLNAGGDPELLQRFRNEAAAAGKLRHRNIVIIHDFGEHEGEPYIVMELLDGEDLQRTMHASHRPLLQVENPEQRLRELYAQREPLYRRTGTMVLTDKRPLRDIVAHVLRVYRQEAALFGK